MAEEFQAGVCSGNWWNVTRTSSGFEGSTAAPSVSSAPCSAAISDFGSFGWTEEMGESKVRSCDEPVASGSGSSVSFQDTQKVQVSDSMAAAGGFLMDSTLPPMAGLDWHQALLTGRAESSSFHAMLQEDDLGTRAYHQQQETSMVESNQVQTPIESSSINPFKDMSQAFLVHQHQLNSGNVSGDCSLTGFPVVSGGSYGFSSTLSQGLFDQHSSIENQSVNYPSPMTYRLNSTEFSQPSWPKFPQLLNVSSPKQHPNQLQYFSNANPLLNSLASSINLPRSGVYPTQHTQFLTQKLEERPNCNNITVKSISEGIRRNSNSATKKSGNETAFKKPRIETPSPLTTFKVRKEKLGDRITALQQLVSPFGKTDTASVLHETIEYIKFLHEQVGVLTTPYFKNGAPMQHHHQNSDKSKDSEGPKQDLKSRGLGLVPISSIYPVANEPTADFWTFPTFGGSFR